MMVISFFTGTAAQSPPGLPSVEAIKDSYSALKPLITAWLAELGTAKPQLLSPNAAGDSVVDVDGEISFPSSDTR